MPKNDKNKTIRCSFCGKTQENVKKIIAGPGVFICDECIKVCGNILEDEFYEEDFELECDTTDNKIPTPAEIKKVLDEYVIRTRRCEKNFICSSI